MVVAAAAALAPNAVEAMKRLAAAALASELQAAAVALALELQAAAVAWALPTKAAAAVAWRREPDGASGPFEEAVVAPKTLAARNRKKKMDKVSRRPSIQKR